MDNNHSVSGFGYAKALIFGEYAVMYGAPGVAAALDAKFEISLHSVQSAPGNRGLQKHDLGDAKDIVLNWLSPKIFARIETDDHLFFDGSGNKFGIGSSAASIAAAVQAHARADALLSGRKIGRRTAILRAIEAHRLIQNGLGSGIDIAASAIGGVVCARNCHASIEISRLPPENLPSMGFFAMHRRAATLPYILAAQRVVSSAPAQTLLSEMTDLYEEMLGDVERGKKQHFIETIPRLTSLLRAWGRCIGMPVIPDGFSAVERMAQDAGAAIKTAGAGGGDLIVAFARDGASIGRLAQKLAECGISRLPFGIAPERDFP